MVYVGVRIWVLATITDRIRVKTKIWIRVRVWVCVSVWLGVSVRGSAIDFGFRLGMG
jgi:hypothetical protein